MAQSKRSVGSSQHRAIVQTITHHGHAPALGLQGLHIGQFVFGCGPRHHLVHPHLCGHALRGVGTVAAEQMGAYAQGFQRCNRLRGVFPHPLAHVNAGEPTAGVGHVHARTRALPLRLVGRIQSTPRPSAQSPLSGVRPLCQQPLTGHLLHFGGDLQLMALEVPRQSL